MADGVETIEATAIAPALPTSSPTALSSAADPTVCTDLVIFGSSTAADEPNDVDEYSRALQHQVRNDFLHVMSDVLTVMAYTHAHACAPT
jgi:hypothetical protein